MYYNEATCSYVNDFLEKIIENREFLYDIPYKINIEQYTEQLKKLNKTSSIKEDIVIFQCSKDTDYDSMTFFVFPLCGERYDCIRFDSEQYEQEYINFVDSILDCVICPDKEGIDRLIEEKTLEIEKLKNNIYTLNNINYQQTKFTKMKNILKEMVDQIGREQTLMRLNKYEQATRTDDKDSVMSDVNDFIKYCIKTVVDND